LTRPAWSSKRCWKLTRRTSSWLEMTLEKSLGRIRDRKAIPVEKLE
jgi:hypothetical protein